MGRLDGRVGPFPGCLLARCTHLFQVRFVNLHLQDSQLDFPLVTSRFPKKDAPLAVRLNKNVIVGMKGMLLFSPTQYPVLS